MSGIKYILHKLTQYVAALFGLSILIFVLTRLLPGDPVRAAIGLGASDEAVQQYRDELRMDEPIYIQYIGWLTDVLSGDLGRSLQTNQAVQADLLQRLPLTIELSLFAIFIAVFVGVPLGVIAGTHKDKWPDHTSRIISLVGVSLPRFWLAILFQLIFVGILGLFPLTGRLSPGVAPPPHITGMYTVDSLLVGDFTRFQHAAWHLTLPAIALSSITLAQVTRLVRSEMIDVSREDYILAAKSYGLPQNLIEKKYMLKNAFSSSLTVIGLELGYLLAGAFYVELIFNLPGIGTYAVNSFLALDLNAIVGVTLLVGLMFITVNALVDVLYAVLDPRLRDGEAS